MIYESNTNLQRARNLTQEFDSIVATMGWSLPMQIDALRAQLRWPSFTWFVQDKLMNSLAKSFNSVIEPMLAEMRHGLYPEPLSDFNFCWEPEFEHETPYEAMIQQRIAYQINTNHYDFRDITIY